MEQQICPPDQQLVTQQQLAQVAQQQMAFQQQQLVQPQQMAQMVQQQQMAQMAQLAQQQQQQQQQMMFCPIRVVYETPVLMQSGDQHQQNQTILVNSPNLPPWVRPVQNQVIYVQQVPQTYGQQYIDPNMLQQNYIQYVQNPQVVNQNLQEQIRQIQQIPNVMPAVQNVQNLQGYSNVQVGNVQSLQENRAGMVQSFEQTQNVQNVQGQVLNSVNRQIMNVNSQTNQVLAQSGNVINAPQTQNLTQNIQQKPVEVPKQMVYRTIRPQANQQQIIRPSIPNQVQTLQAVQNVQNVQNIQVQNYRQPMIARPQIHPNIVQFPTNVQQNIVNSPLNNTVNTMQSIDKNTTAIDSNVKVNNMAVAYTAVRNGQTYSYRAIQPRPMGKNVPNLLPMNIPTQTITRPELPGKPPPIPVTHTAAMVKIESDSIPVNRKRKSESPDEVKKKIASNSVVFGNFTITPTVQGISSANYSNSDKISVSTNQTQSMLQIKPLELGPSDRNRIPMPIIQNNENLPLTRDSSSQVEKDKLVRATVFTQARGRMLNDKPNIPIINQPIANTSQVIPPPVQSSNSSVTQLKTEKNEEEEPIEKIAQPINKDVVMTDTVNSQSTEMKPKTDIKKEEINLPASKNLESPMKAQKPSTAKVTRDMPSLLDDIAPLNEETKSEIVKSEPDVVKTESTPHSSEPIVKIEKLKIVSKDKTEKAAEETISTEVKKESVDESKKDYKNISAADMTGAEIQIVDGTIVRSDKERDFILTHVLDGYVIQESNVPFAIRKPLIEKTIQPNVPAIDKEIKAEAHTKDESKDSAKTSITKDCVVVLSKKIPDLATLKIDETKERLEEVKENASNSDNPFGGLKQEAVKSWSVDQLSAHLAKNEWAETASMFRDHEIDGESLFLASKPQLVTIGVNETHADVIWEFVKN